VILETVSGINDKATAIVLPQAFKGEACGQSVIIVMTRIFPLQKNDMIILDVLNLAKFGFESI
jgi:hypothetical protein